MRTTDRPENRRAHRGPGRYSPDGRWWWDERQRRWLHVTDEHDVLEIEAEDVGGTSWLAGVATILAGEHDVAYYRFVARARAGDGRSAGYTADVGPTFPVTRWVPLDDLVGQGAWAGEITERFEEMQRSLVACGWRPAGRGAHWWSLRFTRAGVDWETPAERQDRHQARS